MCRIKYFMLVVMLIAFGLSSCTKSEIIKPRLVIEGWIEDGSNPVVIITTPITVGQIFDVKNFIARPAKVIINDGTQDWELHGTYDSGFFPPYIYTNFELIGVTGKEYRLTVRYNDIVAESKAIIPESPEISDIYTLPDSNLSGVRNLYLKFLVDSESDEFLMTFVKTPDTGSRFYPSFLGTYKIPPHSGEIEIDVKRPKIKIDSIPYIFGYESGKCVEVELCRITKEAYQFWMTYHDAVSLGKNPLISTGMSLPDYIEGEAEGYFFGYGMDKVKINVE